MRQRYAAMLGAWILWRVMMVPDPSMKQLMVQIWLPEQSFAKFEFCQRAEYTFRDSMQQKEPSDQLGILKFICMPDTFTPPQQEPAR